jgi:hypothetical protein
VIVTRTPKSASKRKVAKEKLKPLTEADAPNGESHII